jgi:hypothetical protein
MAISNSADRSHRSRIRTIGPQLAFVAAVVTAFALSAACAAMLHKDFALPVISTLFFVLSGGIALIAWKLSPASRPDQVTYWDVAGALTFIGICAAAQVEPDQVVRLVEAHRPN